MSLFSLTLPVAQHFAAAPCADIQATFANPSVIECSIFSSSSAANNAVYGLGRSPTAVTQLGATSLLPEDVDGVQSKSTMAVAWSVAPTIPTQFYRRFSTNTAIIGMGIIWQFPRGLTLSEGSSLCIWVSTVGGGLPVPHAHFQTTE